MTRPPLLRDRLPEILGDRPWWDTRHSIRIRPDLGRVVEIEEAFRRAAQIAYYGPGPADGFIVPDALRASLAEILECERTGRGYLDHVRTPPRRSWARRTAARLAALLERFAG